MVQVSEINQSRRYVHQQKEMVHQVEKRSQNKAMMSCMAHLDEAAGHFRGARLDCRKHDIKLMWMPRS